mmetsp:Transcript_53401/g.141859  ORF Transcript_53401/g.141859 Transcript_53401/m.141859 type:complete len:446 (+) Transcript_53401:25-1362(+)
MDPPGPEADAALLESLKRDNETLLRELADDDDDNESRASEAGPVATGEVLRDLMAQWDGERDRLWKRTAELEEAVNRARRRAERTRIEFQQVDDIAARLQHKRKLLVFESVFYRFSYECELAHRVFQCWRSELARVRCERLAVHFHAHEIKGKARRQQIIRNTIRQAFLQEQQASVDQTWAAWKQYTTDRRAEKRQAEAFKIQGKIDATRRVHDEQLEELRHQLAFELRAARGKVDAVDRMVDDAAEELAMRRRQCQDLHEQLEDLAVQKAEQAAQAAQRQEAEEKLRRSWELRQHRQRTRLICSVWKWRDYEELVLLTHIFMGWRQYTWRHRPDPEPSRHGLILPPAVASPRKGMLPYTVVRDPKMLHQAQVWLEQAPGSLGLGIVYLGGPEDVKSGKKSAGGVYKCAPWAAGRASSLPQKGRQPDPPKFGMGNFPQRLEGRAF